MRKLKRTLSVALALCMLLGMLVISSSAATDFSFTMPTEPLAVETTDGQRVLTTLTQRAGSEIPLIFGINVVAGNGFSGLKEMAGTDVNENPDPYMWNYNYLANVAGAELPEGTYYVDVGGTGQSGGNGGLYNSGGANQVYSGVIDELGGVGYAVGYRADVLFGMEADIFDQIEYVNTVLEEDYNPLFTDVQTGTVSSRTYAWTEMGKAISAYLEANPGLTTRYDDPYAIGINVEEFSAGIPYYIASLIADGTIEKKTMAYVTSYNDNTFTCEDPTVSGGYGAGRSDSLFPGVYAQAGNFDYVTGRYTLDQLIAEGVDIIVSGGENVFAKSTIIALYDDSDIAASDAPMVMGKEIFSIQMGQNGWNYAPTTPLQIPAIQAYAYLDELAEVNEAINPAALFEFAIDEFMHVTDEASKEVALSYIGTNWDSVSATYDSIVPDTTDFTYDKEAIIAAIRTGIDYALSGDAAANGNLMLSAYRTSDSAYIILTTLLTTEKPSGDNYITLVDTNGALGTAGVGVYDTDTTGQTFYLDTANCSYETTDRNGTVTVDCSAIVDYYNTNGYGDDFQTTMQNYLTHMANHVWDPSELLSVEGTYGYIEDTEVFLFDDVQDETASYYIPVYWAYAEGITNGTSATTFSPAKSCTRGQFVTFLWRMVGSPEPESTENPFTDVTDTNASYYKAVLWAYENEITLGTSATTFSPNKTITRGQAVTFLYRYEGAPDVSSDNPFTDVTDTAASYYNPVLWAAENGITLGTSSTTFSPSKECTRGQMVTFLYRYNETVG